MTDEETKATARAIAATLARKCRGTRKIWTTYPGRKHSELVQADMRRAEITADVKAWTDDKHKPMVDISLFYLDEQTAYRIMDLIMAELQH